MASDDKDTTKEAKAEEEVKESEGTDTEEEKPEEAPVEESTPDSEEKAAAEEPRPGQQTLEAMSEIEEGWPRSWIVTTAILVIVAIIIAARLVGQSWKQGPKVPRPGLHAGKAPGKGKVPGKGKNVKMARGKVPDRDPGVDPGGDPGEPNKNPPAKQGQPDVPVNETVLFEVVDLTVQPGAFCLDKDKKLIKLKDQFARDDKCIISPPEEDNRWFRVTIGEVVPAGELQFFIQPPKAVDALFSAIYTRFPHGGKTQWFGGKLLPANKSPMPSLAMVIANPTKKTFTAKKIRLAVRSQGKRDTGELVSKVELTDLLFNGDGSFCVTTKGKLVKLANMEAKPDEGCTFDMTGANQIRMEFKHNAGENRIHFQLRPISSGVPVILESNMMGKPGQESRMDMVEGHLMEEASKVALVFRVDAPAEAKVKIMSLTIIGKHRPPNAP